MEGYGAMTGGWMNGVNKRIYEWERREGCMWWSGEKWRLYVTLRFRSASRELVCVWLIPAGWGGAKGREGQSEEETEMKRMWRRGGWWSFFVLPFTFLPPPNAPSPISDVVQVTYSAQGGSLLFLHLILSLSLPPPSVFPLLSWLPECMNEWASLLLLKWGEEGLHRKLWGRREGERMTDKEARERGGERVSIASEKIHGDCWFHVIHRKLLPWCADQSMLCVGVHAHA